uniref:polysaccharide biosynthesis C-terminal domain-containing protein n=1 Tax=Desulfosarcina cetonica TaxID=90730 RepID=UPI0012ECF5B5
AGGPGGVTGDALLYLVLGPTILFQNLNSLRLALLNGMGRHRQAAGLRIRQRIVFLAIVAVLCRMAVPVPLLAIAFPIGQVVMAAMGRRQLKLPGLGVVVASRARIAPMMQKGRAHLFTDNLLDVVFYLDLLILGWFVGPVELGVYARAMVLMRLFLILPAGLQPVFRRQANLLVAAADRLGLQRLVSRTARSLFVIHGLLAIVILVHFPRVMAIFFNLRHWTDQAFGVFALVVPGLVFHSLAIAMTPLFEAIQATDRLKRLALVVAAANTVLNLNLIPFAGLPGAAMATTGAMFIHFWLFCRWLPGDVARIGIFWPGAAAALYLTYVPLEALEIGVPLSMLLAPLIFGGLLWVTGSFGTSTACQEEQPI